MDDLEQVRSYVQAYEWGGPTSALQLHHLRELSQLIRPGDTVLDLACGPGPLILELAAVYPETRFIGADLSPLMLQHLEREATARKLRNIIVLLEDVRYLPSLAASTVDLVITTSALHHLPDEDSLSRVFRRVAELLRRGGGFYMFDFGLLKSDKSRSLFVGEVAKRAPPLTVRDYDLSLQAAFPVQVVIDLAQRELPRPFTAATSAFVDFCYFLQSPRRTVCSPAMRDRSRKTWASLSLSMKAEHLMLRWLRRQKSYD